MLFDLQVLGLWLILSIICIRSEIAENTMHTHGKNGVQPLPI